MRVVFLLAAWWIVALMVPSVCAAAPPRKPAKAKKAVASAVTVKKNKARAATASKRLKNQKKNTKLTRARRASLKTRPGAGKKQPLRPGAARPTIYIFEELPAEALTEELPDLVPPVPDLQARELYDSFRAARSGGRVHRAIDIMRPEGSPLVACVDGVIEKLHWSAAGGTAIYLTDEAGRYRFYYAHLSSYAEGLREGLRVSRGTVIGYVGSTGNASASAPHLHFQIMAAGKATAVVNPHPVLSSVVKNGVQQPAPVPIMPTLPATLASFEVSGLSDGSAPR